MQPSPLKPEEIERKLQITVLEGGGGPLSEILLLQIVFYEESFSTELGVFSPSGLETGLSGNEDLPVSISALSSSATIRDLRPLPRFSFENEMATGNN